MGDVVQIIRVEIEESDTGLLCATSRELPGMVVIHRDIKRIYADLPNVIAKIIKYREKREVEVREVASRGERRLIPDWAAIPRVA